MQKTDPRHQQPEAAGEPMPRLVDAAAGRRPYCRGRDLAALLPLWPHELADMSPEGRLRLIRQLRRALREERRRGLAGHWTYDLARHAALLRAFQAEVADMPLPLTTWAMPPFRQPSSRLLQP